MNESKSKGFLWLDEWADLTRSFTDAQLGRLLRAVQAHSIGEEPKLGKDASVLVAYNFIAGCVDRYKDKYDKICQKRAEAGKRGRDKQLGQMQANADTCGQMQASGANPNPNPNPNPTPYEGVGDTPARPRMGVEFFGIAKNVELLPVEHRTLVEQYGEQVVQDAIDDLSCKIADGTKTTLNAYYTLVHWLRFRSTGTSTTSPQDPYFAEKKVWEKATEEDKQEYLSTHDGLTPWQYEQKHGRI